MASELQRKMRIRNHLVMRLRGAASIAYHMHEPERTLYLGSIDAALIRLGARTMDEQRAYYLREEPSDV